MNGAWASGALPPANALLAANTDGPEGPTSAV
jgi:hypothetical protein